MLNRNEISRPTARGLIWTGLTLFLMSCAGVLGDSGGRTTNAELTLISFGSVQGEILECG